jgi:RND family efflux transporter MFP subunit
MAVSKTLIWMTLTALALCACEERDKKQAAAPQAVRTAEAAVEAYSTSTSITGEVKARIQSELSFRVSGRIIERAVDVGSKVKAGQVLAKIDPQEQLADVGVATASLHAAEAQLTQATLASERQKNLFNSQVTTRANFDAATEALITAQGTLDAARAQLETAKDALSFTELRADADGVVTDRNAEVGQVAQAAQSVFTLAHDGPRDAVFNVVESLFLQESTADVQVRLLSSLQIEITAPVRETSPTIDSTTGTIRVKVALDKTDDQMPLGAVVVGTFMAKSRQAILLPWSAMTSSSGKAAVWVVDPSNQTVSMKKVDVAEYETGKFAVSAGLAPKDIVVVEGGKFLRSGQTVAATLEAQQ